jgi:hypothetical protein
MLGHHFNDSPYVAASLMSVAISQVFGSAMSGPLGHAGQNDLLALGEFTLGTGALEPLVHRKPLPRVPWPRKANRWLRAFDGSLRNFDAIRSLLISASA